MYFHSLSVLVLLLVGFLAAKFTASPLQSSYESRNVGAHWPDWPPKAPAFSKGHDLSSVKLLNDNGYIYKDTAHGNETRPVESILGDGGMNGVRLRIWVNPIDGIYGLSYNLALASRFHTAGYAIYLDFHLSDTWADPGHQAIPAAWSNTSLPSLATSLRTYVSSTLTSFSTAGIPLSIISLGNEIHNGLLWPLGEASPDILSYPERVANFTPMATLWASARAGVRDAAIVPAPSVMIHIDDGWNLTLQESWFSAFTGTGLVQTSDWDVFGFSFYPFYGTDATLANLSTALTALGAQYGKPMHVVETDWPDACPLINETLAGGGLSDPSVPVSVAGQTEWVDDIVGVVQGVPGGLGAGVWYWEPAWLNNTSLGSNCSDVLLFAGDFSAYPEQVVAYSRSSVDMFLVD